jgi:hypothetical protein
MSAFTRPIVAGPAGARLLNRIPLSSGEGVFSERRLQELIFRNPTCLPVNDIDPQIGRLIPVCMEMETGAGPADILFVTSSGQLVLVETKLWRNPEARREVVGQILDYAKQLSTWTYEVLESRVARAARAEKGHLMRCVRGEDASIDEALFVDAVNRSLSEGRFLLLIVGDGIRYGAEALIGFLERYGHLKFGLGLIEVAAFELAPGEMLLHPRVLAKTETLPRNLVALGPTGGSQPREAAEVAEDATDRTAQREWYVAFWKEVIERVSLDDQSESTIEPTRSTNLFFPMPPSGSLSWISAYIARSTGRAGAYLTFSKGYEAAAEIYSQLEMNQQSLGVELGFTPRFEVRERPFVSAPDMSFSDLNQPEDRRRVVEYLAMVSSRMVNVLKPKLREMTKDD